MDIVLNPNNQEVNALLWMDTEASFPMQSLVDYMLISLNFKKAVIVVDGHLLSQSQLSRVSMSFGQLGTQMDGITLAFQDVFLLCLRTHS